MISPVTTSIRYCCHHHHHWLVLVIVFHHQTAVAKASLIEEYHDDHQSVARSSLLRSSSSTSTDEAAAESGRGLTKEIQYDDHKKDAIFWALVGLGLFFLSSLIFLLTYYFWDKRREEIVSAEAAIAAANRPPVGSEEGFDAFEHVDFHQLFRGTTRIVTAHDIANAFPMDMEVGSTTDKCEDNYDRDVRSCPSTASEDISDSSSSDGISSSAPAAVQPDETGGVNIHGNAQQQWWRFRRDPLPTSTSGTHEDSSSSDGSESVNKDHMEGTSEHLEQSSPSSDKRIRSKTTTTTETGIAAIPSTCAICLNEFEKGDHVSWAVPPSSSSSSSSSRSSSSQAKGNKLLTTQCSHVFHTGCIAQYAHTTCTRTFSSRNENGNGGGGKKTTVVDCPLCRGPFLHVPPPPPPPPTTTSSSENATDDGNGTPTTPIRPDDDDAETTEV